MHCRIHLDCVVSFSPPPFNRTELTAGCPSPSPPQREWGWRRRRGGRNLALRTMIRQTGPAPPVRTRPEADSPMDSGEPLFLRPCVLHEEAASLAAIRPVGVTAFLCLAIEVSWVVELTTPVCEYAHSSPVSRLVGPFSRGEMRVEHLRKKRGRGSRRARRASQRACDGSLGEPLPGWDASWEQGFAASAPVAAATGEKFRPQAEAALHLPPTLPTPGQSDTSGLRPSSDPRDPGKPHT